MDVVTTRRRSKYFFCKKNRRVGANDCQSSTTVTNQRFIEGLPKQVNGRSSMKDKFTIPDDVPKNVCRVCLVESGTDILANDCLEAALAQPREQAAPFGPYLLLSCKISRPGLHGAPAVGAHADSMESAICYQLRFVVTENIIKIPSLRPET
jgi:hypothetical protein